MDLGDKSPSSRVGENFVLFRVSVRLSESENWKNFAPGGEFSGKPRYLRVFLGRARKSQLKKTTTKGGPLVISPVRLCILQLRGDHWYFCPCPSPRLGLFLIAGPQRCNGCDSIRDREGEITLNFSFSCDYRFFAPRCFASVFPCSCAGPLNQWWRYVSDKSITRWI